MAPKKQMPTGPPEAAARPSPLVAATSSEQLLAVQDPAVEFGVSPEVVDTFTRRAAHMLANDSPYLDPARARYVVMSVDPAGGGARSDEAFVVFLVAGNRFGLLTARVVAGHDPAYAFSTVPLAFVLSVLYTLREVRQILYRAHAASVFAAQAFRMPPVLLVVENNFGYGAAVYLQMLWFAERKRARHTDLADVRLIFATPVFGLDWQVIDWEIDRTAAERTVAQLQAALRAAEARVDEAWRAKGPRRTVGLSLQGLVASARAAMRLATTEEDAARDGVELVEIEVANILANVMEGVLGRNADRSERAEFLRLWATDLQPLLVEFIHLERRLRAAQATAAQLRTRIRRERHGEDDEAQATTNNNDQSTTTGVFGQGHPFAAIAPFPPGHTVDASTDRIVYPQDFYRAAAKTALGAYTSRAEKVRAYRHFVAAMRSTPAFDCLVLSAASIDPETPDPLQSLRTSPGPLRTHLPRAPTVLRAVYSQWRRLLAIRGPDGRLVAVEGKNNFTNSGDLRDDVWMAFSIGFQWLTRFTRLLPTDTDRRRLVQYMAQSFLFSDSHPLRQNKN